MAKKKDNTAEIGFEEQIWSAADKLRGNIDASEYKNVVLGLIFLKYISDKFDQKYQELVEEGEGFEEDRDEYASENIFFVPESARWKTIAAAAHTPEIGKAIDEAMRQIEAENNKLKGILPKNFARQELDKRRLGEVVDLFTNVKMAEKGDSRDILGRTYEYCLAKFAEAEGQERRRVLHTRVRREDAGRSHRTLPRASVRSVLRQRRHVRTVRGLRQTPSGQH